MKPVGRACVLGAGVAGLGAAAALANQVREVVVLDKDRWSGELEPRKAVPQGEHIHILLEAGIANLEQLLPGIRQDLVAAGSATIRAGVGQQIFAFGRWYPERDLGFDFLGQSRPRLEGVLRRRVGRVANVELRSGWHVERVVQDGRRVTGVVARMQGGAEQMFDCDLVVDATGVGGRFARALVPDLPQEEHVTDVYYSTVHFEKPREHRAKKENILILSDGEQRRVGGSLIDVESDTWCVSLHGRAAEGQPRDAEQWMQYAASLPDPRIFERVATARALAPPIAFRKAKAVFRRFDRVLDRLPLGYVPAGDTIASFNPIFGQGMTVAFGHAVALAEAARDGHDLTEIRARYFPLAARWSSRAWRSTTLHDLGFSAASESERRAASALRALARARQDKAMTDPETHRQIVLASQMMDGAPG